jgi:hypothetical protein
MHLRERNIVQRRKACRAPPIVDAQVLADAPLESGNAALDWQGAAEE